LKELYRTDEVCEMLNISRRTLYRKIVAGEIAAIRFGPRLTRVRKEEILRVLGEGSDGSKNDTVGDDTA